MKNLFFVILLVTAATVGAADVTTTAKKYPPYPDVWRYEGGSKGISYVCAAMNGDFYLYPGQFYKDSPTTTVVGFFSGSTIQLSPKDAEAAAREGMPVAGLGQLKCELSYNYEKSLTLPNGYIVRRRCIGGDCLYPLSMSEEVVDNEQRIVARKVVLQLLRSPRKAKVSGPAGDRPEGDLIERVTQVSLHFISLEDNSFLLFGDGLVRLDSRLNTKFPVNKDHFFIIDTALVENVHREASGKEPIGDLRWHQLVQDMTADLLNRIKQEQRP